MNHPEQLNTCSDCGWRYCAKCEDKCPNCDSPHVIAGYHVFSDNEKRGIDYNSDHPDRSKFELKKKKQYV